MASSTSSASLGFENDLWKAADALRSNMDAAEYKHVVLGLIFLKYISDAFEEQHQKLEAEKSSGADPEDPDEYRAVHIFWVPKEARWAKLKAEAKQPAIGKTVDEAMLAIERDNPTLKGVLPKDYAHPRLDKQRLGQLIDLIGNIGLGDKENRSKDILGRVYEYFLSEFASAEGKKGGQFYTPRSVVRVLVEMLAPWTGRVFDPCCGSGGMFVQSLKFIDAHKTGNGNGGPKGLSRAKAGISVYGQESNHTAWRLAKMNLAIRGIDNNLGPEHADSFHRDLHPDLKADYVLANPPFNDSDWRGDLLRNDKRWVYGVPPAGNANFAWVQHFIHHLAPAGIAGFVLANGSMSSNQSGEGEIRKSIIEADLVDCMVALPGQLFYSTQIPVCLWFLTRDKRGSGVPPVNASNASFRDRRGQTLFIDARKLGTLVDRVHRELSEDDIAKIANTYHAWRGDPTRGTRGTGVPPVNVPPVSTSSGSPVSPTSVTSRTDAIRIRQGAYLPHWTRDGAIYSVCFRLADSLPAKVITAWKKERDELQARTEKADSAAERAIRQRLRKLFSDRVEKYLDAASGACWLKEPRIAQLVVDALKHFDGQRYRLLAWCVMPNHVHVVFKSFEGHDLEQVIHSWKSFTAHEANKLLGRRGKFWQPETYDHLVRDEDDLEHAIEYTLNNPRAVGLVGWQFVGVADDIASILEGANGGPGPADVAQGQGRDAPATYADVPGFCKSATLEDIRHHGHILTPGRYVGAAEVEDDGEPFDEKMKRLTAELREQTEQSEKLDRLIWANLEEIGYGR